MRYAAIDIGTHSCRLLICEQNGDNLSKIHQEMEITRIGAGIDTEGNLSSEAIKRTCACVDDFRKTMQQYGVEAYRAVATSAVRESSNKEYFIKEAHTHSKIDVEIINPEIEAYLSYLGVQKGLNLSTLPLVVDLGGGSTEFMFAGEEKFLTSIPIGAVKATDLDMPAVDISKKIAGLADYKNNLQKYPLVFVGGTATTLVAIKLGMNEYDPALVQGHILKRWEIADIYNMLERMPLNLRRRLPGLQPERADIITKGTLILLLIVDYFTKQEIIVSESDLLEGIVWDLSTGNSQNS